MEVKKSDTSKKHRKHLERQTPSVTCRYCHKLFRFPTGTPENDKAFQAEAVFQNSRFIAPYWTCHKQYRPSSAGINSLQTWFYERRSVVLNNDPSNLKISGPAWKDAERTKRFEEKSHSKPVTANTGDKTQSVRKSKVAKLSDNWDEELEAVRKGDKMYYERHSTSINTPDVSACSAEEKEMADLRKQGLLPIDDATLVGQLSLNDVSRLHEDPGYEIRWAKPKGKRRVNNNNRDWGTSSIFSDADTSGWEDWELASVLEACSEFDEINDDDSRSLRSWSEVETMSNLTI